MSLFCAISNKVPEHPVVSPSSGVLFEKRLIEKHIIEYGEDPVSGQALAIADLIELKICHEVHIYPVVKFSAILDQKKFIEEYIRQNGVDPLSGEVLAVQDLIEMRPPAQVMPPTSIYAQCRELKSMQDGLHATKLYACRQRQEIARLTELAAARATELAAAREARAKLEPQAGVAPAPHAAQ